MKKIILVLITFILLSFQSDYVKEDTKLICSGKWYIEYMKVAEKEIPLPPEMIKNSWAKYSLDGRVEGMDQDGKLNSGKWEYLKETRTIKLLGKEEETTLQKIVSINDSKMVLSITKHGYETIAGFTKK